MKSLLKRQEILKKNRAKLKKKTMNYSLDLLPVKLHKNRV